MFHIENDIDRAMFKVCSVIGILFIVCVIVIVHYVEPC